MSMNNLTTDGEFRYIIQWFSEWSELQRDDFIPIMVDYITDTHNNAPAETTTATAAITNMNGIQNDMERSLNLNGKPMSLFQCRVKLFNQWNRKWPAEFKDKLQQKITELDNKVGERIKESIYVKYNGCGSLTNGYADSNGDDAHHYEQCNDYKTNNGQQPNRIESSGEQQPQQQVENEIIVVTNAVTLNDPMREVLNNETSVDDIELNEDTSKQPQQQQQMNIIGVKDNENVAHDDGINEDCTSNQQLNNDNEHTREPVEQVAQMRNLQINEEGHEDVTASPGQPQQQQPPNTTSAVPVTVTVNPVVAMTTNAEVPLVV